MANRDAFAGHLDATMLQGAGTVAAAPETLAEVVGDELAAVVVRVCEGYSRLGVFGES